MNLVERLDAVNKRLRAELEEEGRERMRCAPLGNTLRSHPLPAKWQGKREDQVAFSAFLLVGIGVLLVLFGLLAGAWLSVQRWGWL